MLQFLLKRIACKDTYTIGRLFVRKGDRWAYLCDTLEDTVRDKNKNGRFDNGETKIKSHTAIPYGTYEITMNVVSPKYSNYSKYPFARRFHAFMPRLINVKDFDGILMHPGNKAKDTDGCILVGFNKQVGMVVDSQKCWISLMENFFMPAKKAKEKIIITIE